MTPDFDFDGVLRDFTLRELSHRAYIYYVVSPRFTTTLDYYFQRLKKPIDETGIAFTSLTTHHFPIGFNIYWSPRFSSRFVANFIHQAGEFFDDDFNLVKRSSRFWVADANVSYRFPKRFGLLTLEMKNAFNKEFRFHEVDSSNPRFANARLFFARFTLAF